MEAEETIPDQVERFENFCIKKNALERNFEVVFAKRDAKAVMDIALAERELESTTQECECLSARVTRARWGDFETTHEHRIPMQYVFRAFPVPVKLSGARRISFPNDQRITGITQAPLNIPTGNKQNGPTSHGVPTSPEFLLGQSSKTVLKERVPLEAQADSQSDTNYDQRTEDDLSGDFLTLLVQRYTDLCHERQTLQEEIEDRLERKERLAKEKLRYAIIHLETIREKAVEVVAVLNEASGGDTQVRLPTGALDETHVALPIDLVSKNPLDGPSLPTPAAGSTPALPIPFNTYSENTVATTVVGSALCPLPSTPRGTTINQITELISELRRTPAAPPPPPLPLPKPPSGITATQQAIFKRYDELIKAAKAAGATVPMPAVPWPLFVQHAHEYPMENVMEKHLVNSSVVDFVCLYSRWKGWNLRNDGQSMRKDWEGLLSVIPEHKRGGRACARKVVSILRELVPDRTGN